MTAKVWTVARAALIFGVGILVVGLVSGVLYEQTQRALDREHFPQIGRSVDIGGRMLNIDCLGAGQPAVILESGANWPLSAAVQGPKTIFANGGPRPGFSWVSIQRALATVTTVCWYDRARSGWSDLGPYPRDSASKARDLHALLRAAQVPPPYVLVGESSAALDARVYSGFYPTEVAGLVLINWADPALFLEVNGKRAKQVPQLVYQSQDVMAQLFNSVGLYRLGRVPPAPPQPKQLTAAEWNTIWFLTRSSRAISALMQDIASCWLSSAEARAGGNLGDRPLVVLSAGSIAAPPEFLGQWTSAQSDLARLSTRGRQVTVGGASGLLYDAPDAIADALRQALTEVRTLH